MDFVRNIEIRWSDLDPNFHVKHSAYYDYGAYCRVAFLYQHGITAEVMMQHALGPILFREECVFKREIRFADELRINLKVQAISANYKKWTMVHELLKNGDTLCATLTVDGAWMNTQLRKITPPPDLFKVALDTLPKTENFQVL